MTALLCDSFDRYNGMGANVGLNSMWQALNATTGASLVAGRYGGQALQVAGQNVNPRMWGRTFTAQSTFSFGLDISVVVAAQFSGGIIWLYSNSTPMCGVLLDGDNKLQIVRLTSQTAWVSLGTAANALPTTNYYWLDGEITISDTVGVMNIYINGDTTTYGVTASGLDNRNGSPTTINTIFLGHATTGSGQNTLATVKFDNLIVSDSTTKLGPRKGKILYPSADVLQGFSRSTGADNFSLVDEATPDSDTSYVQGGLGALDRYEFDNLGFNPSTVDMVQAYAFMEATDVYPRQAALQIKSGATVDDGVNFNMGSLAYGCAERPMVVNPATSAAFTVSEIDAIQGGPKVTV